MIRPVRQQRAQPAKPYTCPGCLRPRQLNSVEHALGLFCWRCEKQVNPRGDKR